MWEEGVEDLDNYGLNDDIDNDHVMNDDIVDDVDRPALSSIMIFDDLDIEFDMVKKINFLWISNDFLEASWRLRYFNYLPLDILGKWNWELCGGWGGDEGEKELDELPFSHGWPCLVENKLS